LDAHLPPTASMKRESDYPAWAYYRTPVDLTRQFGANWKSRSAHSPEDSPSAVLALSVSGTPRIVAAPPTSKEFDNDYHLQRRHSPSNWPALAQGRIHFLRYQETASMPANNGLLGNFGYDGTTPARQAELPAEPSAHQGTSARMAFGDIGMARRNFRAG